MDETKQDGRFKLNHIKNYFKYKQSKQFKRLKLKDCQTGLKKKKKQDPKNKQASRFQQYGVYKNPLQI